MKTYEASPYPVSVHFSTDGAAMKKILGRTAPKGSDGYCVWTNKGIFMHVADGRDATLVHEVVHASLWVLEHVGIDPSSNNGECLAYLVDNMFTYFKGELKDGIE